MPDSSENDLRTAEYRLYHNQADLQLRLSELGDHLAQKHGYSHDGLDALRFHLMQKHNWLPRDVHSLSFNDLYFATADEQKAWQQDQP